MFRTCETEFNLSRHLIPFLQDAAFYAEISRHIRKVPTRDLPTCAVTFDVKTDEMRLYWNPDFFESLSNSAIRGALKHEFNHLVFGHLVSRRRTPHKLWNVATDLAINSLIVEHAGKSQDASDPDTSPLPACALIPGRWPLHPDGRSLSQEEKEGAKLASLIAGFPKMKASEWYFFRLMEEAQKEAQERKARGEGESDGDGEGEQFPGEGWLDSMDDHSPWDEVPDEVREYVEGKVKALVEKAVRHADGQANGWGDIPADIREDIRKSVSNEINWRVVLRQFVGTLNRGDRTTSIKRINRRYPYVHPGAKRGYTAKLLVAMDQSGSVYDQMVEDFFAELGALTKKVDISILPFDCSCSEDDITEWKRGMPAPLKRTKTGGTDFDAPTAIFNDPKNRGRWDGCLIMTDGCAPAPGPARKRRGWVLGQGCKLMFPSDELTISMSKERPMVGAWR